MTNPDTDLMFSIIVMDADLRDGKLDTIITKTNFTAAINDADRADSTNSSKGDGKITSKGLGETITTKRTEAFQEFQRRGGDKEASIYSGYLNAYLAHTGAFRNRNVSISESVVRRLANEQIKRGELTIK